MDQYNIEYDEGLCLVKVVAHGDLPRPLGEEIITRARTLAAENECDVLCDVREASADVSLADWFFMPRELGVLQDARMRRIRSAVVISSSDEEHYTFYETVAVNLGLNVKIFYSEAEALNWLRQARSWTPAKTS